LNILNPQVIRTSGQAISGPVRAEGGTAPLFQIKAPVDGFRASDIRLVNAYSLLRALAASPLSHAVLERISGTVTAFGVQIDAGAAITLRDIDLTLAAPAGAYPCGVHLKAVAGALIEDCVMRGFQSAPDPSAVYPNGDGFGDEAGSSGVVYRRCQAYDARDGGFDLKSKDVQVTACSAHRAHRSIRIWTSGVIDGFLSDSPRDCDIWLGEGATATARNIAFAGPNRPKARLEPGAVLTLPAALMNVVSIVYKSGARVIWA
jgi:hypothetical protein